jgi:hypothetical protein
MCPWIAIAYSTPIVAIIAIFFIYLIGQRSFSDDMPFLAS